MLERNSNNRDSNLFERKKSAEINPSNNSNNNPQPLLNQ